QQDRPAAVRGLRSGAVARAPGERASGGRAHRGVGAYGRGRRGVPRLARRAARAPPGGGVISERTRANTEFFAASSARVAAVCDERAQRFGGGGRLLACGEESDARHVAVEFVHPVIVGKRALPALALPRAALELEAEPDDIVVSFDGAVTICGEVFDPPT